MTVTEKDIRDWLAAFVVSQVWPFATLAQLLDQKGVASMAETREAFERTLALMKVNLSVPSVNDAIRPDFMFMQSMVDTLKQLEVGKTSTSDGRRN